MASTEQVTFDNNTELIFGLNLTSKWMAELVEQLCGIGKAKLIDIHSDTTEVDHGLLSVVAKLKFQWSGDGTSCIELPESVIIKVPTLAKLQQANGNKKPSANDEQSDLNFLKRTHNTECCTYSFFTGLNQNPPVLIPCIYGVKEFVDKSLPAYILMEDLSGKAKTPDLIDGLSIEQCKRIIENLASLHAFCITNPDWNSQSVFKVQRLQDWGAFQEMFNRQIDALVKYSPTIFTDISLTTDDVLRLFDMEIAFSELEAKENPVLVHGDLHLYNTLFGSVEGCDRNTTDELVGIIDWQMVNSGYCTADMARLFMSSLDWKLRRENEEQLLEYYYETLLAKIPDVIEIPYSLEEVKLMYYKKSFLFYSMFFIFTTVPLMHLGQNATKYSTEQLKSLVRRAQAAVEDTTKHLGWQMA